MGGGRKDGDNVYITRKEYRKRKRTINIIGNMGGILAIAFVIGYVALLLWLGYR